MTIPRIGLVGMGGFALTHKSYIDAVEKVQMGKQVAQVAIMSDREIYNQELKRLKKENVSVFPNLRDMLAEMRDDLDLVCIPTGIPLHRTMTISCLEAGCNVFVEKPAAGCIQDFDAMLRTQQSSRRFCAVGFQHAYSPDYLRLKDFIVSGKLGKINRVRTLGSWPRNLDYYKRNNWAGQLSVDDIWVLDSPHNNAFSHAVNIALFLGSRQNKGILNPTFIQAELYRANPIFSPDTAVFRVNTEEGTELFFSFTHCGDRKIDPQHVFEGELGIATLNYSGEVSIEMCDGRSEKWTASFIEPKVLQNVMEHIMGKSELRVPLETTRAQVLCASGSFDSSEVIELPKYRISQNTHGEFTFDGMTELLFEAHRKCSLFSEMGVEWGIRGRKIDLKEYNYFPKSPHSNHVMQKKY